MRAGLAFLPLVLFRTRLFGSLERPKRPTALPSTTHAPHPTRHPPRTRVPHSFHELVKTFCCGHGLRARVVLETPKTHSRGFGTPLAQPLQLRPTRTSPHTFHELVKTFGAGTACALESSWRPEKRTRAGGSFHELVKIATTTAPTHPNIPA